MLRKVLLAASLYYANLGFSSPWLHSQVVSQEKVAITLDYTYERDAFDGCYKCTFYDRTSNLWINVTADWLSNSDRVRVVLLNKSYPFWSAGEYFNLETREIDLSFAEDGRFTASISALKLFGSGYGGKEIFELELAVVINGVWLLDPISQSHNFRVSMPR